MQGCQVLALALVFDSTVAPRYNGPHSKEYSRPQPDGRGLLYPLLTFHVLFAYLVKHTKNREFQHSFTSPTQIEGPPFKCSIA